MARFLHRREDVRALHAPYSALLEEHYARRGPDVLRALPYPERLEDWTAGRGALRQRLLRALGLDPQWVEAPPEARGAVPARTTGTVDRAADGYRIELVELQTAPRVYASALLYLPAGVAAGDAGARLPAVYSPHGHYRTGKHTRSIQIRCANLARRGYAVLIMDAVGHAERAFMGHREPAAHALLYAGASLPGLQVLDNIRGLDYLQSRPEVDPSRIGVTGVSGGGNHTMYLAAVDERVAAAVPVCSVEMLESYFRKSQCVCETVPDLLTFADKPHLLGLIAPRPLLIMNGMRDGGFATLSSRRAVDHARRIYSLYADGDARLARYEANVEHSYDRAMREQTYAWFDRWLKGLSAAAAAAGSAEADTWVEAEEDDTLRVWGPFGAGAAGGRPADALTLDGYYAARAADVAPPAGETSPADRRRRIVDDLFGGWPQPSPLAPETVDTLTRSDCAVEVLVYWSEDGVPVPALLFRATGSPDGGASTAERRPAVVYASAAGKARAAELRAIHEAVRAGTIVLAIDYRGQGETAGSGQTEGELAAVERGIMMHRPLFAGRVWDVLQGVAYLAARPDVDPDAVYVWGERETALLALHAAALDERVAGAACLALPETYRGAPDQTVTLEPWLVVPGLLAVADVADLRALVSPRPCLTGNPAEAADLIPRLTTSTR
jgi:dienelactone hydrolase